MHRAHLARPLHVVHGFELRCHLAELSERTAVLVSASFTRRRARAASSVLSASWASRSRTVASAAVRLFTFRVNTTAAAGAPPITEENDPSTVGTSMFSFSALEKTTKASP